MEQSISVVIPWRWKKTRQFGFDAVCKWYRDNLPQANIITVDDGRTPFCLSGSRNLGVKQAEEAGANIVILSDADTVPEIGPLLFAIELAEKFDQVVLPYTEYRSLRADGTRQFKYGMALPRCNCFIVDGACSGVYVFRPETWWKHYGQDERFRGWGFEDAAWYAAHKTLLGKEPRRVDGVVYAFSHASALKEGPDYERNAQLCASYLNAEGNVDAMVELAAQGLFVKD